MATCATCKDPLVLKIGPEDDDEDVQMGGSSSEAATKTVPDDVQLNACGCHFHWDCLLESYTVTSCPHCSTPLTITSPTGEQQILCTLRNEGGIQTDLDILPLLTEEGYLRAYPEERKCRAFLEFCREGDVQAIAYMLLNEDDEDDEDEDEEEAGPPVPRAELLRYQDPIGGMSSGLHVAVANQHIEVQWLLLLLASNLPFEQFPAAVFQEAEQLGVMRNEEELEGKADIRSLKDADGQYAVQIAQNMGPVRAGGPSVAQLAP